MNKNTKPKSIIKANAKTKSTKRSGKIPDQLKIGKHYSYSVGEYFYDIINGLYSGFPPCCIAHYCKLMHKGLLPASYNDWKYSGIVNNNAGYVQCKKCMESKKCLNHNRIRKGFIREKTFTKLLDLGYQVFFEEADQVFKQ